MGFIIGLVALLSITIYMATTFAPKVKGYSDAKSVSRVINNITDESRYYYALHVLKTRCLWDNSLHINKVESPSSDAYATYQVSYTQSGIPNTKPTGISIKATIRSPNAEKIIEFLNPDERLSNQLTFYKSLNYELKDYQQLNVANGCIK